MKALESARRLLRLEGESVLRLAQSLDDSFVEAVALIERCRGRVVFLGVGKSGHIGRKLAATMASTGTTATFVHATEAMHGDLGMITRDDVVIAISHSGETAETVVAVKALAPIGPKVIAMTARPDCTLARMADVVLLTRVEAEGDPLGLAPTVSTTATLALGDALAIALMARRGFSREDFHRFHPGGALGKQLEQEKQATTPGPVARQTSPAVVVVGSFMMDVVVRAQRRPQPGETLVGDSLSMFPGGKGFNQAIAASRIGAPCAMVGRLGRDAFGDRFMEVLTAEGVDARYVRRDAEHGTGVATPVIDTTGQNSIIIVPQANQRVTPEDVQAARPVFEAARVVVLQGEIALPATVEAARLGKEHGCLVILNPAPAGSFPEELLASTDVLIPNEVEAAALTGINTDTMDGVREAARKLLALGPSEVIITLGSRGCFRVNAEGEWHLPPFPVQPVDTTGAGDAFVGTLAASLAQGMPTDKALLRANAAGALATTRLGAMPSMPTAAEVDELLATHSVR
ncbi:MAG: ribokinase [Symbiobacterium sp.]|uniref:ribokinase n=1 Tax=Symbiobacterium sp. TaxID=1971213 RepID=UPI0034644B5C